MSALAALTNPRQLAPDPFVFGTFRQLDIYGTTAPMPRRSRIVGAIAIDNAGQTECECGETASLIVVGTRWSMGERIPIWGNDCCSFWCDGDHVSSRWTASSCANCNCCGDCCECSYCESCEQSVTETERCNRCSNCCTCQTCERCGSHQDVWTCEDCSRCEDCCSCNYCRSCENGDQTIRECCDQCLYCCECETEDDCSDPIEIGLPYTAGDWSKYMGPFAARTFGVELEFSSMSPVRAASVVSAAGMPCRFRDYTHDGCHEWKTVTDSSVTGGGEAVSPILSGDDGMAQLSSAMFALRANGATVNGTCGTHVHVGVDDLSAIDIVRIVKFYDAHHSMIDLLHVPSRRGSASWSGPYREGSETNRLDAIETLELTDDERKREFRYMERYRSVNVTAFAKYGTLEFRQHAGTLNVAKIQSWIGFLFALIAAAVAGEGRAKDLPSLLAMLKRYGLSDIHAAYLTERAQVLA